MKLTVDLDTTWEDEYGETSISLLIKNQIEQAIKNEVCVAIRNLVQKEIEPLKRRLHMEFAKVTEEGRSPILERLIKLGELERNL